MKSIYKLFAIILVISFSACEDLTEVNENPNGVDPSTVDPNLMLSTVISQTGSNYLSDMGFGDVSGVMQYTQKSGWSNAYNNFNWDTKSWSSYYSTLRTNRSMNIRAIEEGMEFHQGVALVMSAFNFGVITDGWGDAPYTSALQGDSEDTENQFPRFDAQEDIYKGIIEELKEANTLLSKNEYKNVNPDADLIYNGDASKWRKFANSLMLRYYMRVSVKLPEYSAAGIAEIVSNPSQYPIFTSDADDATMGYPGNSSSYSWPTNSTYDNSGSNFARVQMGAGIRDVMVPINDPRLSVWFEKVSVPIKISSMYAPTADTIVNSVRYLTPEDVEENNYKIYSKETFVADAAAGLVLIDTASEYTGIPTAYQNAEPYTYNLNPNPVQGGSNIHISALADMYKEASGPMLLCRLMSYSEVCFILSEAAFEGVSAGGSAEEWYNKGIKGSLSTWGVEDEYDAFIAQPEVAYNGTKEQIMTQKWISNWTAASEAWFDWRRTGLPELVFGEAGKRDAMPLRFYYGEDERDRNKDNYDKAVLALEKTEYVTLDEGRDSAWSKAWLIKDTGLPY